jgi:tRNA(fMet)-specific endonuclease VapC
MLLAIRSIRKGRSTRNFGHEECADFYSFILNSLRQAGTPIPTNDIWIAATALQHGYKLFSQDKHFDYVHGIMIIRS